MLTLRQIEKFWADSAHGKIIGQLLAMRAECSPRLIGDLAHPLAAAAMTVIRLDELGQQGAGLCRKLIQTILASQDNEGGWVDPTTTALCLRALMCGNGQGVAIERGLAWLANLQRPEGAWPQESLRRMPADGFVTAFVLLQLGGDARFAQSVRMDEAMMWLEAHKDEIGVDARRLMALAAPRCRYPRLRPALSPAAAA